MSIMGPLSILTHCRSLPTLTLYFFREIRKYGISQLKYSGNSNGGRTEIKNHLNQIPGGKYCILIFNMPIVIFTTSECLISVFTLVLKIYFKQAMHKTSPDIIRCQAPACKVLEEVKLWVKLDELLQKILIGKRTQRPTCGQVKNLLR